MFFRKLHTKYLKVFFVYCLSLFVFIVGSFSVLVFLKDKNLYVNLLNFYSFLEFVIISLIIYFYSNRKWVRVSVLMIIAVLISYHLYNYFILGRLTLNYSHNTITSIILIVYILFFFYTKMKTVTTIPLYQTMSFWIFVAFFLYYTGNFFFFLILGSEQSLEIQKFMIYVYSGVTILKNIILCASFRFQEPIKLNNQNLSIPSDLNLDDLSPFNSKSEI